MNWDFFAINVILQSRSPIVLVVQEPLPETNVRSTEPGEMADVS